MNSKGAMLGSSYIESDLYYTPKKTKNTLLIIYKFNAWAHFVRFDLSSVGQDMVRVIKVKNIEVVNI